MPIRITNLIVIAYILLGTGLCAQDVFKSGDGWGAGWNNNAECTEPFWGGGTWDYNNTLGPTNRYFRFFTDYSGCNLEWGPPDDDFEMTSGTPIYLTAGNTKAYFVQVADTAWHYIFRTRNLNECSTPQAVYFEIQGDVRTITNVSQNPAVVYPGQEVNVNITLSGASNPGQGYYLRYTSDNWISSAITELTGSGTNYSASIPASSNTPSAQIEYYVFSSGAGLTIPHSEADFFTFSLNNDLGNNYQYTVALDWETVNDGPWEDPATWVANVVPVENQPIKIDAHIVTTSSDKTVSSLVIRNFGVLDLGTNTSLILPSFSNITVNGSLNGASGSKLLAPEGGYINGLGLVSLYDLEIGEDEGTGNKSFYLDQDIEISNDLLIQDNGGLYPGDDKNVSLVMSGTTGDIYIHGQLDCVPTELGVVLGERLALEIPTGAHIILRPSDSVLGDIKFGDITIETGASLSSDAAGVLDIELQFGTLSCDGLLNFGQTSPGNVNVTFRGTAGNNYALHSNNSGQIFQFSNLLIGNNGASDGGNLFLADGSESIELRVSGNFSNYYKFSAINDILESINVVMNGFTNDQAIRGDIGQTFGNKTSFANLTIDNGGSDVYLSSSSIDGNADNNVSYEISGILTLSQGKLITLESDIRHNLILLEDASISSPGAQSIESGHPCYVEGPMIRETGIGPGRSLSFPLGQNGDYRDLIFQSDVANSSVRVKAEHFAFSANFTNMTVESPIVNVSDARFWNVKTSLPNNLSNTQFILSYGDEETDGVTNEDDLRVVWAEQDASTDADSENNKWQQIGLSGGTEGSLPSGVYSFSNEGVSQIDLTIGNVGLGVNPLPVTWLSISCLSLPDYNQINWTTASESNSSHFVLQRAKSDFSFYDIGETDATGWSNEKTQYSIIDSSPHTGTNYYRIKQIDRDGSFSFSETVSASYTGQSKVYPNPFQNKIIVVTESLLEGSNVELWSSTGVLISIHHTSKQLISIPTEQLSLGVYLIKTIDKSGEHKIVKLVKN